MPRHERDLPTLQRYGHTGCVLPEPDRISILVLPGLRRLWRQVHARASGNQARESSERVSEASYESHNTMIAALYAALATTALIGLALQIDFIVKGKRKQRHRQHREGRDSHAA